jgi:hypothetical protein
MSWLFSQALVAEYSAASCSDGAPSAPSNTTPTQQAFLWRDKTTAAWNRFPSGMTCEPLTDDRGEGLLKLFLAASHAPTSAPPARVQESPASSQDCGAKWRELSVKFDRNTFSWKTAHCLLSEDLPWSSVTLPKWGMMRAGELWERTMQERRTGGIGAGFLPTPTAKDAASSARITTKTNKYQDAKTWSLATLTDAARLWPTPTARDAKGGYAGGRIRNGKVSWDTLDVAVQYTDNRDKLGGSLNPNWVDWLIGWPIGHTALDALATDKFQQWLRSHGVCSEGRAMTEEAA